MQKRIISAKKYLADRATNAMYTVIKKARRFNLSTKLS